MENCLQDNLRILTQETVSQRALRTVLRWGERPVYVIFYKVLHVFFKIMNEWVYGCTLLLLGFLWLWCRGLLTAVVSPVAERSLWEHGLQWLGHAGSKAVVLGSGVWAQSPWHTAWLLHSRWHLPDQGLSQCCLHWQMDSYPLHHQRSPCIRDDEGVSGIQHAPC